MDIALAHIGQIAARRGEVFVVVENHDVMMGGSRADQEINDRQSSITRLSHEQILSRVNPSPGQLGYGYVLVQALAADVSCGPRRDLRCRAGFGARAGPALRSAADLPSQRQGSAMTG